MQLQVSATDGKSRYIAVQPGDTLAQAVYLSGIFAPRPLCSGLGSCGLCRMRFVSAAPAALPEDERILGPEAVALGWRLGCKHKPVPGDQVVVPESVEAAPLTAVRSASSDKSPETLFLAVDLGTTSLAWSALEESIGNNAPLSIVRQGQELNPQIGAGSDVLSRLSSAMAPGGEKRLQNVTLAALRRIVAELPAPVSRICLAANTAMTALTRGASVLGLTSAPYALEFRGNCEESLPDLPPIYFPPQISAFIGGDISAGLAFILTQKPKFPFLFADLGTNGEFVLVLSAARSMAVSVPLGPALEGIGLSCGALAGVGGRARVITGFELTPQGLRARTVADEVASAPSSGDGENPPVYDGISGTGYLSLAHILRKLNLVREDGRFNSSGASESELSPLAGRLAKQLRVEGRQAALALPGGLSLNGTDLEELLKVKAAFSVAVHCLLSAAELTPARVQNCYLAGALGKYVQVDDLFGLGFLPEALKPNRVNVVGNAALAGAEFLLGNEQAREAAVQWAAGAKTLNLTADKTFMRLYLNHMRFCFPPPDHV